MEGDRNRYIESRISRLTHYWVGTILLLGIILFLLLSVLDYIAAREKFSEFFVLRLSISAILLLWYGALKTFDKTRENRPFQHSIILTGTFLSAATVQIMIMRLGGHDSFYYAGLNLIVICVLGFVPLSVTVSALCVSIIYFIYLIPILAFDNIHDIAHFGANNAFLVSTFIIALVWRALNQKNLKTMLGLQYDQDKNRQELALYSTDLERLVEERTHALNKSELMFRSLFENATDAIMILNPLGIILNVNSRACEMYGLERNHLIGMNAAALEPEENRAEFRNRLKRALAGESLLYETRYKKNGETLMLEVSSRAVRVNEAVLVQCFYRDVTEKKRIQEQLLQSQKMQSIGQLAGGIAHDFNNILAAILGNVELIIRREDVSAWTLEKARRIEHASRRGAQMVSKLLSFSKRSSIELTIFDLNNVVDDTIDMLKMLIPRNIDVVKNFQSGLTVRGDVNHIEQVIMNLVLNARDAMPRGGTLVVSTEALQVPAGGHGSDPAIPPGTYAVLGISDTGGGIRESDLPHIFEPFYTTKEKSKGMGLGLAMVYGIVESHKGHIRVNSKVGEGTSFHIYLPGAPEYAPPKQESAQDMTWGNETLLIIDDDASVLEFACELLTSRGFKTLCTDSSLKGFDLYREKMNEIDLVITDIIMPGMDGVQLAIKIRELNPGAKIISITGFNEYKEEICTNALLRKPFSGQKLLTTVREVLDYQGVSE